MAGKFGESSSLMTLLVTIVMFAVSRGNKLEDWPFPNTNYSNYNYNNNYTGDWWSRFGNHHQHRLNNTAKTIVVGGSEHWHFGFNYTKWAINNAPFYLNDTLVFKYDAPNATTFPHSVYQFPNMWSFIKCDLKKAKMLAKPTEGGGEGFKFVLNKWKPHYLGCGERNGFHCNNGTMKFAVFPIIPPFWPTP